MPQILQDIFYFFSFQNSTINSVLFGTLLLGLSSGLIGILTVLNKKALIVDAVSHSLLPGICIGFLLSGTKNPIFLVSGGMVTGAISVLLVSWIPQVSKIKTDAAIAIVLSTLFALGVIGLNVIELSGSTNQAGINTFLFGKAVAIVKSDLYFFSAICLFTLIIIPLFYTQFKIYLFDEGFSKSIGIKKYLMQFILSFLIIIITAVGVQTVGVVLMAALLITPASTALFWTKKYKTAMILSGIIGALSALFGVLTSYILPNLPTGPTIVIFLSLVAFTSILFSPKGIVRNKILLRSNRTKILTDNVLKTVFKILENQNDFSLVLTKLQINQQRNFNKPQIIKALKVLTHKGYLLNDGFGYVLTNKGKLQAERIVRLHRLWELYLQVYMNLPADHVHDSAESIEHIITPELEHTLTKIMGNPSHDPHQQKIPYKE